MNTFVIAEAGVNHNGDPEQALAMVDAAARAGADAVKFQTFEASRLVTRQAKKADYQAVATGADELQFEMLQRLELAPRVYEGLVARCATLGIGFLSTGFDEGSVDFLVRLGVDRLKVPSGEVTNLPYLRHVGRQGLPVLLSTGMATLVEIGDALDVLGRAGTARSRITVLHCTTEYPTPMSHVNLKAMDTIRESFGVAVGYSDHTEGIEVSLAAAARGAVVIEKHFTLDRSQPGPDHRSSLEPPDLAAMVAAIRNIDRALGDGVKQPGPGEVHNRIPARRSIVAATTIRKGELFGEHNLAAKRPGTGLSPMRWLEVIGRAASRDFGVDEEITL